FNSYLVSLEGIFFSGSVKTMGTMAFFFPSNFDRYINDTLVDDITTFKSWSLDLVAGFKGYVNEDRYKEMLNGTYYGSKVPIEKQDLNTAPFPYWSSPSIT